MSIFTKDQTVPAGFADALKQVADYKPAVNEDCVVPGYGSLTQAACAREAEQSAVEAKKHAANGNHEAAGYHYQRAAMFHRALHNHIQLMTPQNNEGVVEAKQPTRTQDNLIGKLKASSGHAHELYKSILKAKKAKSKE
ncbi:MAG: hypothetical protein ACREQ5_05210 [Candidatus Dormibacteria bacterium]